MQEVESKLESVINSLLTEQKESSARLASSISVDYDDIQDRATANKIHRKLQEKITFFNNYQNSPYFARIDLTSTNPDTGLPQKETFYIGKKGLSIDSKPIVLDWRCDFGDCYNQKTETEFCIKETHYQLHLRRELDIQNAQLQSYFTEFDAARVTRDRLIVDPFLLKVLQDKQQEHRLTDIIKTTQDNQNSIIRKPQGNSFIVQGCAGSGKTMILLHRLSYLKYSEKNLSLSRVKIITPNKSFTQHIQGLSNELELAQIQQSTIDEYYVNLIHRFSKNLSANSYVFNENELSEKLLTELYSPAYLDSCINHYHSYWNHIFTQLNELALPTLFEKFELNYPTTTKHKKSVYQQLESDALTIKRKIAKNQQDLPRTINNIAKTEKNLQAIQKQLLAKNLFTAPSKDAKDYEKTRRDLERKKSSEQKWLYDENEKLLKLRKQNVSKAESQNLNKAILLIKKLNLLSISRDVMRKDMIELCQKHSQPYPKKNYHYKLYLKLVFCTLYYTHINSLDYFLNIDEAQDLSLCEYRMLRGVLGKKTIFNLYGDTKQVISSYKGIRDWHEISNLLSCEIYLLNENYRNSTQITKYCNHEFRLTMQPIGLSQAPVLEQSLNRSIQWCLQQKEKDASYRIAIIVKDDTPITRKCIKKLVPPGSVAWFQIDLTKLSLITVQQAKGIEFDAVVVLTHLMTPNDLYVSYTRAICKLFITTDSFPIESSIKKAEEISTDLGNLDLLNDELPKEKRK